MSDTTASTPDTSTPPADAPPSPAGAAPAEPPKARPPADPAAKLDQWRAKLDRQAESNKRKLDEIHEARRAFEQERAQHGERLTKAEQIEQAIARLKSGDFDVLKELAGDDYLDKITRAHLDPEAARRDAESRKALAEKDAELKALKKRIDDWEAQQNDRARQAAQAEQARAFLATARKRDSDELALYSDDELIHFANVFGSKLHEETGQDPTMAEVIDAILEHEARPRFSRVTARGWAKGSTTTTPAKKEVEPSTVSAADASTPAGEAPKTPMTAREKREAAQKKMEAELRALNARKGAA